MNGASNPNLLLNPGHVNLRKILKIIFKPTCSKAQGWPAYYLAIMFSLAHQISIIISTFNPNLWVIIPTSTHCLTKFELFTFILQEM